MSTPIVTSVRVRWGDCDPGGLVFYPRFLEWMDFSADRVCELVGVVRSGRGPLLTPLAAGAVWRGLPVVKTDAEFLSPAYAADVLDVKLWIVRIGKSSLGLRHEFVRSQDGMLVARGSEHRVHVAVDPSVGQFQPQEFTAEIRSALEAHLETA